MKLTLIQRIFSHLSIFILLISGFVWLMFNFVIEHDSPWRFLNAWSLKIHGLAAFASLVTFGMLISTHISFNWRVKKNRRLSGIFLTAFFLILILSGYFLYYLGDEDIRNIMSWIHWICGIVAGLFFIFHFLFSSKNLGQKPAKMKI